MRRENEAELAQLQRIYDIRKPFSLLLILKGRKHERWFGRFGIGDRAIAAGEDAVASAGKFGHLDAVDYLVIDERTGLHVERGEAVASTPEQIAATVAYRLRYHLINGASEAQRVTEREAAVTEMTALTGEDRFRELSYLALLEECERLALERPRDEAKHAVAA